MKEYTWDAAVNRANKLARKYPGETFFVVKHDNYSLDHLVFDVCNDEDLDTFYCYEDPVYDACYLGLVTNVRR